MTPGERDYDIKLVKAAREQAQWVSSRSRKVALTINQLADRLDALSREILIAKQEKQPASTPV